MSLDSVLMFLSRVAGAIDWQAPSDGLAVK
jgi:hypothetical protein